MKQDIKDWAEDKEEKRNMKSLTKFFKGNREHNNDFPEMSVAEVLKNLQDELIDASWYVDMGLDALEKQAKKWYVPKYRINDTNYGKMLIDAVSWKYGIEGEGIAQKVRVFEIVEEIDNEGLNNIFKEYLDEKV